MRIIDNTTFLDACLRKPTNYTPVWMMRQAGRYLSEYREVRAKAGNFLNLCKNPELAAEVTIQPVDILDVDAAILFSDILVVPEAMGMKLDFLEGEGPHFSHPIITQKDVDNLKIINPNKDLDYVMQTINVINKDLLGRVPLIGFSGAPWTLATYMVEGGSTKNFAKIKKMIYTEPKLAHSLLSKISNAVADYLIAQIESGVNAVQIFDTWGGILTEPAFDEFSLNYIKQIIVKIKAHNPNIPIITFVKGGGLWLDKIADAGTNVVGLDWNVDIGKVRKAVGDRVALQGNMDPTILYASPDAIEKEVIRILDSYGKGSGHIFNLGHGILPDIPVENAKAFIKAVKKHSGKYH